MLPFIISLSASACYDLMKYFVKKKKKDTSYRKIQISGDAEGVICALDILKEEEKEI